MHHKSIMFLIMGSLVAFGIYALVVMPKNEFPSFTVRQGVVVAAYPGATAEEVETQVTKPLEKFLWEFKEVVRDKTYSQSKEGMCYVFLTLDNINTRDEFWSKFKLKLQQFKSNLPSGVLALMAIDDFGDTSAMLITLESDDKTYRELHDYVGDLEDRLRTIKELSAIRVSGEQTEQIAVYIDRDRLSSYGINAATLLSSIQGQGMQIMSGSLDDGSLVRPIHIQSQTASEYDVAEMIVYSDPAGRVVRLRNVAEVKREYPDADTYVKNNGHKCLVVSVEMQEGNNIVDFADKVKDEIAAFQKTLPESVKIFTITDQGKMVNDSIMDFLKELLISIIAVIIVIMLLLPFRVAGVAAGTIPITVFISLAVFYFLGVELNTVTLAALILTLGMIVDNSIVIIDCYIEQIGQGRSRWHAASASAKEFFSAIFSATLAISITFVPLLFTMSNMMKDFIKWFPYAISIILGVSLLVAVFMVPYLQYAFIKKGLKKKEGEENKKTFLDRMQATYDWLIDHCFNHPYITLLIGIAGIIVGGILFGVVPQALMPRAERNQFAVEIYLPAGTAMERTEQVADSLRDMMKKDERVVNITTFYGSGSPRFHTAYAPQMGGTNFAQFIVNTKGNKATEDLLDEFSEKYPNYFSDAQIRLKQLDYTDALSPVEIRFLGDDLPTLHRLTDKAAAIMRQKPELTFVRTTFEGTQPAVKITLNEEEANRLGLSKTLLSLNLATRFGSGLPAATVWEGDYPVSVVIKDKNAGHQSADGMENATVSGMLPGVNVPLRQVADVQPDFNYGQIVRYNGIRAMSATADIKRGLNLNKVTDGVLASLDSVRVEAEKAGVKMIAGGQREKDNDYGPQIYGGLALSIVVIFAILIFHFRNIKLSLLIMASLLFSVAAAPYGMLIMGQDMSMTGTLGMISLMGIIVRNGIIMIDYAEELRLKERYSAKQAALHAAKRRMRPIFLTSAAASMGCVPMVIANSPMWGPLGVTVCFGTLISMLYIITMIPIGYWLIFRQLDKKRHNVNKNLQPVAATAVALMLAVVPVNAQEVYNLQQCRELALQNNVKLRNQRLEIESAKLQEQEAKASYFPQVTAGASYFHANDYLIKQNISVGEEQQQNLGATMQAMGLDPTALASLPMNYELGYIKQGAFVNFMALQPVYMGGRITAGNKLAKLQTEVKQLMLEQTEDDVVKTVEGYYNQLLSLYEKQKTVAAASKQVAEIYKDANNAYNAGVANRNDVLTVQLKQNELTVDSLKLINGINVCRLVLAQYIGHAGEQIDIDRSLTDEIPHPSTYLTDHPSALANRVESALLDKSVEAEKLQTKLKQGEMLPQVAVGATAYYHNLVSGGDARIIGLATVSIPISEWWSNKGVKRQKIAQKIAEQNREDNRQLMLIQMQSAYDNLDNAYQQVLVARKSITQSEENLRLNRDFYQAGMSPMSDLLDAQTKCQQAYDQLTEAKINYLNCRTAYLIAVGKN